MKIIEMQRGKVERSRFIYARLVTGEDNYTVISATLDYILGACLQRGYTIENWQEVQDFLRAEFDKV